MAAAHKTSPANVSLLVWAILVHFGSDLHRLETSIYRSSSSKVVVGNGGLNPSIVSALCLVLSWKVTYKSIQFYNACLSRNYPNCFQYIFAFIHALRVVHHYIWEGGWFHRALDPDLDLSNLACPPVFFVMSHEVK